VEIASAPARRNIRAVRMGSKRLKADDRSDFGAAWRGDAPDAALSNDPTRERRVTVGGGALFCGVAGKH
jgi:hypothetical protein